MCCCVLDYYSTREVKEEVPAMSFDLGGEEVVDKFKRGDRDNGFEPTNYLLLMHCFPELVRPKY